jgi:ribosome-binding protein aMBF1 (putative translation factor)
MIPRMLRWLAIAALVFSTSAQAQVFKPGKSSSSSSKTSSKSSSKKSSAHRTSAHKSTSKKKKAKADDEPKVDPDYVKIIDDDDE